MRQIFLEKGLIKVKQVAEPFLDEDLILVSVNYSCISPGTENAAIAQSQASFFSNAKSKLTKVFESLAADGITGTKALVKERLLGSVQALGYSCSGKVIAVGKKITKFKPGDLVACAGANLAHHADIVAVPENLVVGVPDHALLKPASLTTLGAIALQGFRRSQAQLGEKVAVIGLGILGQLTVQLAKAAGCEVIGIDILPDRLALASKNGADMVFDARKDILKDLSFSTEHHGVDCTIITASAKSDQIIQQAMHITRKKGRVVLVGDVELKLERSPFYEKEIDFLISCSYGPGRYDQAYERQGHDYPYAYVRWTENRNMQAFIDMLAKKHINIDCLLTDEFSINDAVQAYEKLQQQDVVCAVLHYDENIDEKNNKIQQVTDAITAETPVYKPAVAGQVRLGVVGAGGFVKVKLLPLISRMQHVKVQAIVDTNPSVSLRTSKLYSAAKSLAHDEQLFQEDLVDVVLIASPHKYHAAQALRAMRQGKAVFLEKPMVTDFEQFDQLMNFLKTQPNMPFCVDYNRSFAPFIKKIKKVVATRKTPLVIQYRMNAGFIPKEHWVQTELGAGRIIGEACHIFDVFCFLTQSKPLSVSVETIKTNQEDLFATDNFSVQFSFADGSICSLVYTSLGHKDLNKERMEVFFDGKAILMDDYKILQGFGLPASFNEKMLAADKGHEHVLKAFFEALARPTYTPPIPLDRLETTAHMTLMVDRLALHGGGNTEITSMNQT